MPLEPGDSSIKMFNLLDQIVAVLGTTKTSFFPFFEDVGSELRSYGTGGVVAQTRPTQASGILALETEFEPFKHVGGINSYYIRGSTDNHIRTVADNANHSFDDSGTNVFSLGAWIMIHEAVGAARSIIAKFDTAGNLEEYDLRIDTSGFPVLELHDASASAAEIATSDDAITAQVWQFIVATYDSAGGTSANAGIKLYLNGSAVSAITLSDSGTYVAMENTATPLLYGARLVTATPGQELEGRLALPFICGKELSATNVASLYGIGQKLLGLT